MRRFLDRLYRLALWLAALCLLAIAVLVGLQLGARLIDGTLKLLRLGSFPFVILSLAEMAGYFLAAATFLALAATLKAGEHIRVTMVLTALPERVRWLVEFWALAFASCAAGWLTWRVALLAQDSWRFNEVSIGMLPIPLVIPQLAMTVGAAFLTVALFDELVLVARNGRPSFRASEDTLAPAKEA